MPRHVAHVEAFGLPWRSRRRRQREILEALSARYPALSDKSGRLPSARPMATYGFAKQMTPEEAVERLVALLDLVDEDWRKYVRVWDGFHGKHGPVVRA